MKHIYLDVCALSRPFDNQNYLRIKIETIAVNLILAKIVQEGAYILLVSPVHNEEIAAIEDLFERTYLQSMISALGRPVKANLINARKRAEELVELGFGIADAAHTAFAELADAYFISCDDRLIRKCHRQKIKIWCGSPVAFCEEERLL